MESSGVDHSQELEELAERMVELVADIGCTQERPAEDHPVAGTVVAEG